MALDVAGGGDAFIEIVEMTSHGDDATPIGHAEVAAMLLLESGRTVETTISGDSMEPSIPRGARVRIRCDKDLQLDRGTVVAFRGVAGRLTAHRIVWGSRWGSARHLIVTQGDSNLLCDNPVARDDVLGTVSAWWCDGEWRSLPSHVRRYPL